MLELNIANKLDNNKVLITEQDKLNPNKPVRYYITKEDNADKFIRSKNSVNSLNAFQKVGTAMLATLSGLYAGAKINSNFVVKSAVALATGAGIFAGCQKLDKMVCEQSETNNLKRFEAEEITGDEERISAALKYEPKETTETTETEETEKPE